jgi:hypothetical protein
VRQAVKVQPRRLAMAIAAIYGAAPVRRTTAALPLPCHCRGRKMITLCRVCGGTSTVVVIA